ncbi:MAG: AAA family ATPase [Bryobacteraceae bacterium]
MHLETATTPEEVLRELRAASEQRVEGKAKSGPPRVLDICQILALEVPAPKMLVESVLPTAGACLLFGAAKSGKTLLAVQTLLAVAGGRPLFDYYHVLEPGPVLIVEQDDPAGAGSLKAILERSAALVADLPFYLAPRIPYTFGSALSTWLGEQIKSRGLRLVVLDSYTALRGSRAGGADIVKVEQTDLTSLDELAKRTGCCILVVHHSSKGSAGLDWSDKAAGTYAMSAATEMQIHITRFGELETSAPERLVRVRGRHTEGGDMVLRFRKDSLDYEHVLEGGAAPLFPLVREIETAFGTQSFGPMELSNAIGMSRRTAHRYIDELYRAGSLSKRGYGEYALTGGRP